VRKVVILWMDGEQKIYTCALCYVKDGELILVENDSHAAREDTRHFPLVNIRTWKVAHR
jgi:hypothetical protein